MAKKRKKRKSTKRQRTKSIGNRIADAIAVLSGSGKLASDSKSPPKVSASELREEITLAQSNFTTFFGQDTYRSQDAIVRSKGRGRFEWYDSMVDSDAVLAGTIETRIDSVARLDWDIVPASDEDQDKEIAEYVKEALHGLDNFDEDLTELLAACRNGYAVSEIVWKDDEIKGKSLLVPDRILSKPPDLFRFDTEGNIYFTGGSTASAQGELMPDYKFIHYPFRPRYQNPYGMSLLRAVYWVWWFKHHGFEQWMRATERGAVGTVIIQYDPSANKDEIAALIEDAKILLKSKYYVNSKDHEVTLPDVKMDSNFGDVLIQRCNLEMIYRLLGATQSTTTEKTGSRAQGESHEKQLQKRIETDSKAIAARLNNTLIRYIVELNFPEIKEMPKFKQHYEERKDIALTIKALEAGANFGIPISIKDTAKLLDLPLAKEGDDLIQAPADTVVTPGDESDTDTGTEAEDEEPEPEEDEDTEEKTPIRKVLPEAVVRLKRRGANFRYAKEKISEAAYEAGLPTYNALADQVDAWLLGQKDIEAALNNVDEFELDTQQFRITMHDTILWGLLKGMFIVFDLPKYKKKNSTEQEADSRSEQLAQWKPMKAADAIAHFKKKKILTDEEFKELNAWSKRNALTAAHLTEEVIEGKLKPALEKALEQGMTIRQFQGEVRTVVINDAHAENIFRTNTATSFISGNMEASRTDHGKAAIPAMEFMAIVDDRTTPMCEERDGQIYSANKVEDLEIVPPLHYQCRSDLIPVFEDEWDGKAAKLPKTPAMEGFGRWKPILSKAA